MRFSFGFGAVLLGVSVAATMATGFSGKRSGFPEQFENPKWDATKPPVIDEPPIEISKAAMAWDKAMKESSPFCDSKRSLIASNGSRLEAVGVKDKNIEVRGAFLRFRTCLLPEPEAGNARGQGWVELGSWDSGLAARDRRVTRYVFGVERDGQSIAPFDFEVTPWRLPPPKQSPDTPAPEDSWDATLKARVTFRGLPVPVEFPVTVIRKNGVTRLFSKKDAQLSFMSEAVEKGFQEMMALCNHKFLATYSLVSFDLNLLPLHKIGTVKPKKK